MDWAKAVPQAFDWLCQCRRNAPSSADIWDLRRTWHWQGPELVRVLRQGHYRFAPLLRQPYTRDELASVADGRSRPALWSARDALVLKALSLHLALVLPGSERCTHLAGHGGAKGAVRQVSGALAKHRYFCRTDVRSFYASIDHFVLLDRLALYVRDRELLNLLCQYMRRSVEFGGTFEDVTRGLSAGCPLSPLMGAFYLHELDKALSSQHPNCFYVRFMDDVLIMAPSRWRLRRAIATMNRHFEALGLEKHPDKTSMGPLSRGFEFLGYRFAPDGRLSLAAGVLRRHQEKMRRLYEQCKRQQRTARRAYAGASHHSATKHPRAKGAHHTKHDPPDTTTDAWIDRRLKAYQSRFKGWAKGGLQDVAFDDAILDGCGC